MADLVGKSVNIVNPNSGTEATWGVMWGAIGHKNFDLKIVAQMKSAQTHSAFCDNKIYAFFWLVGNPSALNKEAATTCDVVFADLDHPTIDKLIADNSFYRWATIPGCVYYGNPDDTKKIGVGATFISSIYASTNTVYQVVKAVFGNFK